MAVATAAMVAATVAMAAATAAMAASVPEMGVGTRVTAETTSLGGAAAVTGDALLFSSVLWSEVVFLLRKLSGYIYIYIGYSEVYI